MSIPHVHTILQTWGFFLVILKGTIDIQSHFPIRDQEAYVPGRTIPSHFYSKPSNYYK